MDKRTSYLISDDNLLLVGKALSSPKRVQILKLLADNSHNIKEISQLLKMPFTTVASNIDILERAGLVSSVYESGSRGSMKLCSITNEELIINLIPPKDKKLNKRQKISIPIGSYTDINVLPTCGIASKKGFIGKDDDIRTLYDPHRYEAELLWFSSGYVEYTVPLHHITSISSISITMELCSEAPFFREKYPSDITLSFNGVDLGIYTSPGDFGGRRGKLTPKWWPSLSTQYGLIKTWRIDNYHTTVDNREISKVSIADLKITDKIAKLRISVKKDAHHCGGINIFGSSFGDYPIDIEIEVNH